MLIDFFYSLRAAKLPVSVKEYLTLLEALKGNVIAPSLDEFYYLARITLVKDEQYFDKFDQAFGAYFKGVAQTSELAFDIPLDWLKLLLAEDIPPEALRSSDQKQIIPPLHGALLKNEQDVSLFERLIFMNRNNR